MSIHAVLVLLVSATDPATSFAPDKAPPALAPAVGRAAKAADALQKTLLERLQKALADGGPKHAIGVCADDASKLSAELAKAHGVELGRTSHKIRNDKNAPRAWLEPLLAAAQGKKVKEVTPVVVDLGTKLGLARPLGVQAFCLQCHGANLEPALATELAKRYPKDHATGFAEGDFRGFLWVEVAKP